MEGGTLIKLQILGFSRKRAEMLKDFLTKGHSLAPETMLCDVKAMLHIGYQLLERRTWRSRAPSTSVIEV